MTLPSAPYRDEAIDPSATVWYATGSGWWQAGGGTLASGWNAGDPSGAGAPSTRAEEQVRLPALPPKKNNDDFSVTPSPPEIPAVTAYSMATEPLRRAQDASEPPTGTWVEAGPRERAESRADTAAIARAMSQRAQERARDVAPLAERHTWAAEPMSDAEAAAGIRMHRLAERISWLELELRTLVQERDALQRRH